MMMMMMMIPVMQCTPPLSPGSLFVKGFYLRPGPRCSKLTMLLVNVSLKFQMLKSEIPHYFLSKECEKLLQASLIFSTKNISVFGLKL